MTDIKTRFRCKHRNYELVIEDVCKDCSDPCDSWRLLEWVRQGVRILGGIERSEGGDDGRKDKRFVVSDRKFYV